MSYTTRELFKIETRLNKAIEGLNLTLPQFMDYMEYDLDEVLSGELLDPILRHCARTLNLCGCTALDYGY